MSSVSDWEIIGLEEQWQLLSMEDFEIYDAEDLEADLERAGLSTTSAAETKKKELPVEPQLSTSSDEPKAELLLAADQDDVFDVPPPPIPTIRYLCPGCQKCLGEEGYS